MANDRPDPGEFLEMAQRMLRDLFRPPPSEDDPWAEATRREREPYSRERHREPSAEEQRQNLTFALATRAVEALEDLALNVAAIRQRLERTGPQPPAGRTEAEPPRPGGDDTGGQTPPIDPGPVA